MSNKFTQLTNVKNFNNLMLRVIDNVGSTATFGCFYGASGVGKTTAAMWAMNYHNAVYIEVGASWTKKTLVENLGKQLSVYKIRSIPDGVERIIKAIGADPERVRPIIIDEADYLLDGLKIPKIEIIREIRDATGCAVILLGEGQLPSNLSSIERVYNRVLDWVVAGKADLEDTKSLVKIYSPDIELSPDLTRQINVECAGIVRDMETEIKKVYNYCTGEDLNKIDLATFKKKIGFKPKHPRNGGSATK